MKKPLAVILLAGFTVFEAAAVPAFTLTGVEGFRNDSWSFGEKFVVGAESITVDQLGFIDIGRDGFIDAGHDVGIFREDGTLLVSTTVLATDPLVGDFRYHSITPIVLSAGESYRVIGVNNNDLYNIDTSPVIVDPRITRTGYAYGNSDTLQFMNDFTGTERLWVANFNIGDPRPTPEAGTTLAFLGMGLLSLVGFARRK